MRTLTVSKEGTCDVAVGGKVRAVDALDCGENMRDRRKARRYPLRLRGRVWHPRDCSFMAKARTRDLSSSGLYLLVEATPSPPVNHGEWLELEISLMTHPLEPFEVVLKGIGQVVRTEQTSMKSAPLGVAVELARHELIRRPTEGFPHSGQT
ncbi:MAG: PilZ domain-containing protein [Acidobacteria bacterium]|nr:PilZ domain-containing protein [Acidobacteriota bacterium]